MDIDTLFKNSEQNHLINTKKDLFVYYAISVVLALVGMICLFKDISDGAAESLHNILIDLAISLCGIAASLCIYFRHKIPARIKFYSFSFIAAIVGIYMFLHPYGGTRLGPTATKIVGVLCTIFSGGGGLLILFNDIKYHYEHRNDVYEDDGKNELTDGLIRIDANDESEILNAINQFNIQENKNGFSEPKVNRYNDHSILVLSKIDYNYFCLLFNYLVYRKRPKPDYSLRGWLKNWHLKSGSNVIDGPMMFFILDSDTDYDNVYFLTTAGLCYKQDLCGFEKITKVDSNEISFKLPNYIEIENNTI